MLLRAFLIANLLSLCLASDIPAEEPLHARIDQLILAAGEGTTPADSSGESEFFRRLMLDLSGRIPTREETVAFLADESADKRAQAIDRMLASSDYPRRMQELFHVILMERRGDDENWLRFLRAAFEENLPWDRIVRTILIPEPDDEKFQGAGYFLTGRLISEGAMAPVDVPGLTRDVGRLLAGVDLQCAQCHDHLEYEDYKQQDFQGLLMIFENVETRRDVKFPAVTEKLMTSPQQFQSVFVQEPRTTEPVVPGGEIIPIATFPAGEEYLVPPDKKQRTPGVPKFSPLKALANGLTSAENELFARNIANRMWFVMMGRGLIEPLDLNHSQNPASHPELLDLLARELTAHQFDLKWFLRELALSETYQRSSRLPESDSQIDPRSFLVAQEKRLSAEQLFWSTLIATGEAERLRAGTKPEQAHEPHSLEQLVERHASLKSLKKEFLKTFANPPQEPEITFEPSVKAALYLMHDKQVLELLESREGNLAQRLNAQQDNRKLVEDLFLTVFSRMPEEAELQQTVAYLESHQSQRAEAIGQLAWAMLASTEFCVNH
ncbi:MAG TPA: DUF1553 domain-containing protein [Planctomycetaceae bacterium]|nr:DUF1553 domain-containing protein [Planctomycetaceae bacterium]